MNKPFSHLSIHTQEAIVWARRALAAYEQAERFEQRLSRLVQYIPDGEMKEYIDATQGTA